MPLLKRHHYKIELSVFIFFVCITSGGPIPPALAQEDPYRILVTNDDGILAPGIRALSEELSKVGELIVVAPEGNRSGSSMSMSINDMVQVEKHEISEGISGYGVNGTPANAVQFGILELAKAKRIDLVVSGINHGQNVGKLSHMSGTVGAAMFAAYLGIPSVAVSLDLNENDYRFAAQFTARFVTQLKQRGAPKGTILSINLPASTPDKIKGVVAAPMGGSSIQFQGFEERRSPSGRPYYWPRLVGATEFPDGTDSQAYKNMMITITPLKFDWTDYEYLTELAEWDLEVK